MVKKGIKRQIERFKKILTKNSIHYNRVILFGSHAKGWASLMSDIDVCVVFDDKKSMPEGIRAKLIMLSGLNGLNMDIITTTVDEYKKNMISPILHQIRKSGIRI